MASSLVLHAIDRRAAFHTDAHSAERTASLAAHGYSTRLVRHHHRGGDACAFKHLHCPAIHGDGKDLTQQRVYSFRATLTRP